MDTKFVLLWIVGIVAVSVMAVIAESSITGDITGEVANYRASAKLYGPALRRAMAQQERLARVNPEQLDIQMYQGQILANKDALVCGVSPDGPSPCMWFEDRNQWCCLPSARPQTALSELPQKQPYVYVPLKDRSYR